MIVHIDYETCDSHGASFEYFRKDFKVFSLSCAWRDVDGTIKQWFSTNQLRIKQKLLTLNRNQDQIVAHNLPYERGVTEAVYPGLSLNWHADTMRLAQLRDGGGDEFAAPVLTLDQTLALELEEITEKEINKEHYKKIGLSLEACSARFLDSDMHNHKQPAHDWLKNTYKIKSKLGQYLHLLPYKMLEDYNNADTMATLLLYEDCIQFFKKHNFDWQRDNTLYMHRAEVMPKAYFQGINVNQSKLLEYIKDIEIEIKDVETKFFTDFAKELDLVRRYRYKKFVQSHVYDPDLKSEKARARRWASIVDGKHDASWKHFNVGSSNQLSVLFEDILGMSPKFLTKKGSPSFKSTHIHQWGDGGLILLKRKKRLLVLQQAVNTYIGSLYDSKIHCSIKVSGTRTNRVAGGRV